MNQNTLSILFLLKKDKTNKQGICPIYCRITYLKKRKQFSTGEFINPKEWNSKRQQASSEKEINQQLEIINSGIKKTYIQLQLTDIEFNVDDIFKNYTGKAPKEELSTSQYFKKFLDQKKKLIGIDIELATWKKYNYVYEQAKAFIKWKYGKQDLPLGKLKPKFLVDFEYYLKTERAQVQVNINKTIQRFRKPIKNAVGEGYLEKDPFVLHKPGRVRKQVVFLSHDELSVLENHTFMQARLQMVKDLFIFCCYTGLAYNEMSTLTKDHIVKGFDGAYWIQMKRKKTGKPISIPILPKVQDILTKYEAQHELALPKYS